MNAIRARLAALLAATVIAALTRWGLTGLDQTAHQELAVWLNGSFDVVLFAGYAVVHPWLQRRWNPTGAFTEDAARKLAKSADIELCE